MKVQTTLVASFISAWGILLAAGALSYRTLHQAEAARENSMRSARELMTLARISDTTSLELFETLQSILLKTQSPGQLDLAQAERAAAFRDGQSSRKVGSLEVLYQEIQADLDAATVSSDPSQKEALLGRAAATHYSRFTEELRMAQQEALWEDQENSSSLSSSLRALQRTLALLSITAGLFAAILSWIVSRSIFQKLKGLEAATARIAKNDFDVSLRTDGSNNEFSKLADAFNRMARSLKETREKLVEQQLALIHSSKLSALGEMAAGMAHEINNPLAILQLNIERIHGLCEKEPSRPDPACTQAIIDSTTKARTMVLRISRIVKALRTFARDGERDPFELASLSCLVEEAVELCRERFKFHGAQLLLDEIPSGLELECRPTQISQVILNLLNNAFDAIEPLPEKWIRVSVTSRDDQVILSLTDSGSGVPESIRSKMLQPFFTTKPPGKGTGLGLSISKGIIEGHSGELWVDTTSPNTRFCIRLPIRQPARQAEPASI